ncbi:hypothetical protein BDR26DRAFT_854544 [Obelidium mucronatum]|nr:hypothetical protein BDR26DRAFT_854544 [Obelidium mucronatum]
MKKILLEIIWLPFTTPGAFNTNCGVGQANFNACVYNALFSGSQSFTTIEAFCAPKQTVSQYAWYSCLCDASTMIVSCYQNGCPNDPTSASMATTQLSYCTASKANAPVTASSTIAPAVSGVKTNTVNNAAVTTAAGASASATQSANAKSGASLMGISILVAVSAVLFV